MFCVWKKEISVDHFKSPNISISLKKSFWAGSTKYSVKFSKNGMNDFDLIHCLVSASIHLFHFHITTVFSSFNLILLSLLRSSSWEPVSISQFLIPVFQHIVLPFRPAFMPHYSSSSHLLPRPENLFQGLNQPSANSALVPESRLRGPVLFLTFAWETFLIWHFIRVLAKYFCVSLSIVL